MEFDLQWHDDSMVWNATEHHGIQRLVVDEGETWIPFLSLTNMHHFSSPYINDEKVSLKKIEYEFDAYAYLLKNYCIPYM